MQFGFEPYVTRFCKFHWKPNGCQLVVENNAHNRQFITIDDPAVLVRFVGYVMRHYHRATGGTVYLRAQSFDYGSMRPSLFRDIPDEKIPMLAQAHEALIARLQRVFVQERLKTQELGALLQHYGLKTPWIDVVDNLYTAVWFASSTGFYLQSDPKEAWLFLIGTGGGSLPNLRVTNLRVRHSSLTLRPHAQHGFSLTRPQAVAWSAENACMNEYILAAIRIKRPREWAISGKLADHHFMFPPPEADHTYSLLLDHRTSDALKQTLTEFGLREGDLGTIMPPAK